MAHNKKKYSEAVTELKIILAQLEQIEEGDMDEISKKVKTATELLAICKNQLYEIDEELEKLLQALD